MKNIERQHGASMINRRGLLGVFAATIVTAAPAYANIFGFLKGAGDVRRIRLNAQRTGEQLNTIYWADGAYIPEALDEISYLMRDARTGKVKQIDPRTIDIIAAVHRLMDTDEAFLLLSGYRTASSNAKLRGATSRVAKNSLHIKGQAADLRLSGRSVKQLSAAAISCEAGGVGKYSRSNFIHMDCGPIRVWGR